MHIANAQQGTPVVTSNAVPKIKFETEVMDYGTIEKGADQERTFKFTNIGKAPLALTSVNSSCGCLVAKWPSEPIAPGKSASIIAHYDTNRVGRFEKTLTVVSNDAERPNIVLKIKGEVVEPK
jgi:hypothetical protein